MFEYAHSFGAVTASTAATFSLETTFRGNPNVPQTARIMYAIIRNNTGGSVTVTGPVGSSVVGIGERKRVEMTGGSRWFNVIPTATVSAGELTADVGMEGTRY